MYSEIIVKFAFLINITNRNYAWAYYTMTVLPEFRGI
jgi:hypothetical protein